MITIGVSSSKAAPAATKGDVNPKTTRILDVSLRPELPCQSAVVRAAARRAGITFTVAPDGRSVTITL